MSEIDNLYAAVLGLKAPWAIERVETHLEAGEVHVWVALPKGERWVWWRRRGVVLVDTPVAAPVSPEPAGNWPALRARRRRWAELLRLVCQVEVEVCPRCGGAMSIVAFITESAVVRRILAHLERRGIETRAGPWADVAAAPG